MNTQANFLLDHEHADATMAPMEKQGNVYTFSPVRGGKMRDDAAKSLALKKLMLGTPQGPDHATQVPSIESKRREVLTKLQTTLSPADAGGVSGHILGEKIRMNATQPNHIPSNILHKINTAAIAGGDFEMIGNMSHYIQHEAANEKMFDPNIEDTPRLASHIKNIKPDHPIRIRTTLGELTILRVTPFFQTHETVKVYHKADILFQGVKRRVLIREDMFQVGNTTEILGDFDTKDHLQLANRGKTLFSIQSIHSEKNQRNNPQLTLMEKFGKGIASIKNRFLGMIGK